MFTCEICNNKWTKDRLSRSPGAICKTCFTYLVRSAPLFREDKQNRREFVRKCTEAEIYYRTNKIGGYEEKDFQELMQWKGEYV